MRRTGLWDLPSSYSNLANSKQKPCLCKHRSSINYRTPSNVRPNPRRPQPSKTNVLLHPSNNSTSSPPLPLDKSSATLERKDFNEDSYPPFSSPSSSTFVPKTKARGLLVILSCLLRKVVRRFSRQAKVANLDFEARVPVPFSIFPSTYRDTESQTTAQTHQEVDINLPNKQPAGREGQYSSHKYNEEEVRFTREEDLRRRPGFQSEQYITEEHR